MKEFTLTVLIALCSLCSHAQLYWKWAHTSTANLYSTGNIGTGTAIDNAGNVYVVGAIVDTCTIGNVTLTPRPVGDMLIVKYNKAGQLLWAKAPRGTYDGAAVQSIVTGTDGHVYIAGWARPPSYFDTIVAGTQHPNDYTYVASMDSNGNFIWVKTGKGLNGWSLHIKNRQLAVDADNNVYLSNGAGGGGGTYRCFDTLLTAAYGGANIIKFNPAGVVQWRYSMYGNNFFGNSLCSPLMHATGNKELLYAGGLPRIDTLHSNHSYFNLVIGKLDSNGNRIWHKEFGDTLLYNWQFDVLGSDMTVDDQGNMYVFGTYSKTFQIGTGPYGSPSKAFITKFDKDGNTVWTQFINKNISGSAISYNQYKRQLLLTSCYNGALTLGNYTISVPVAGTYVNMFVAAYDTAGNVAWLATYGRDSTATVPFRTSINNTQKMYAATGYFADSTSFGNYPIYASGASTYHRDFFVAVASLDSNKSTVGMPQAIAGLEFKIYPNPATGYVVIQTEEINGSVELLLINTLGQPVYSSPLHTTSTTIPLSQFANGHYLIAIKKGDAIFAKPLLVWHK